MTEPKRMPDYVNGLPKCEECPTPSLHRIDDDTYYCREHERYYGVPESIKMRESGAKDMFEYLESK